MTTTAISTPWIAYTRPNPRARLRLFCFPYAGGSASVFRAWANDVPPEIEVYPIQLPGRETRLREKPFTQLTPILPLLTQAIQPYLTMPFAFFGHSLGALISFELARYLRREHGYGPVHLFMSGHRAPHRPNPDPPIHELPDAEFLEEVRQFNGTPEELLGNAEMMRLVLPILRADFAIYETHVYTPEEPLDCPISAFGGLGDVEVSRDDSAAWRDLTRGSFSLRMFPGNHFFLNSARAQVVQAVSQDVMRLLQRMTESQ